MKTTLDLVIKNFMKKLNANNKLNKGYPDTEAMRITLFGQCAFHYEQACQDVYKRVS